ncbi:MAG: L,D-transpeptidase family protein, partial [Geothrix sp.]|nr:L,D-transpeptidase family protein [Geothrix sp.]
MIDPVHAARYRALALANQARQGAPTLGPSSKVVVVDVARQRLGLLEGDRLAYEAVISTARNGLGCEQDSYRTPTGWHRIHARIGAGAEPGSVFRSRVATGEVWRGEALDEDLILSRVITLDGLEEGWNRGPGRDSLARFIYLHGTNQEGQLGTPVSHGCVRLGNATVIELFDRVAEGDLLLIAEEFVGDGFGLGRLHFAGVAGSGMSALAQFVAMKGGRASGSDRSFDRGQRPEARAQLGALGVMIHPQDGSGLEGDCAALVVSTAVEEEVPDVAAARRLGIPVLH